MKQEELEKKYEQRRQWFLQRIGKTIYRNKTSCNCDTCTNVYLNGMVVTDKMHAEYLNDCEGILDMAYFDTKEEVTEYEKLHPPKQKPRPRKRVSAKK